MVSTGTGTGEGRGGEGGAVAHTLHGGEIRSTRNRLKKIKMTEEINVRLELKEKGY